MQRRDQSDDVCGIEGVSATSGEAISLASLADSTGRYDHGARG
jgi:hypothetical protein